MLANYFRALLPYIRHPTHILKNIRWRRPKQPSLQNHIFVVGAPRSGTTLIQVILAAHPRLCSYQGESGLFSWQDAFNERRRFFGLEKTIQQKLLRDTRDIVQFFDRVAELICNQEGGERFVEKTPQHVLHLSFLRRHFPNSKFVHMQRDGRDCFCSARSASIPHGDSLKQFARYWRRCIDTRLKQEDDAQIIDVRYEDLTSDPETTVAEIMAFVGEPFDDQQLAIEERASDKRASVGKFFKLSKPIDSKSQGRWRKELSPEEVATFQRIAGRQLKLVGYPIH